MSSEVNISRINLEASKRARANKGVQASEPRAAQQASEGQASKRAAEGKPSGRQKAPQGSESRAREKRKAAKREGSERKREQRAKAKSKALRKGHKLIKRRLDFALAGDAEAKRRERERGEQESCRGGECGGHPDLVSPKKGKRRGATDQKPRARRRTGRCS